MAKGKLLLNKEYEIEGTWYAPVRYLRDNFKSVVKAELYNTTSSCGDWDGWFVQKVGRKYYVITFSQEVVPWTGYYKLYTGNMAWEFDFNPDKEVCNELMDELYDAYAA